MTDTVATTHNYTISRATPDEAEDVFSIFEDVIAWLTTQGRDQWVGEFDANDIREKWMALGEVALVRDDTGLPVATATLYHVARPFDAQVWAGVLPEGAPTDDATYLHKLAVRRDYAGQGISDFVLDYADEVARAQGKKYVRLDTDADVPALCAFYEGMSYIRKGAIYHNAGTEHHTEWHVALYEKKVG